jgi:hypothetical protein
MPGEDVSPRGPAPEPGEHTFEVLAAAGYSSDELAKFEAEGVTGHKPIPGSPLEVWAQTMASAADNSSRNGLD